MFPDFIVVEKVLIKYEKYTDREVVIPEGIEIIAEKAFWQHHEIRSIQLPTTLKRIESQAFYSCSKLETVNINSTNLEIEERAFAHCRIRSIDLSNCSKVGTYAFEYNPLYFVSLGSSDNKCICPNRFEEGSFAGIRVPKENCFEHSIFYDQTFVKDPILYFDCYVEDKDVEKWMTPPYRLSSVKYFVVARDTLITTCNMSNASTWLRMMSSAPTYITDDSLNANGSQLTILELFGMLSIIIRKSHSSPDRHINCSYYLSWLERINYNFPNKARDKFGWLKDDPVNDDHVFEHFYLKASIAIMHQLVHKWNVHAIQEYCTLVGTEKIKSFMSIFVSSLVLLHKYNIEDQLATSISNILINAYKYQSIVYGEKSNQEYRIIFENGLYCLVCGETIVKAVGHCDTFVIDKRFSHIAQYAFNNTSYIKKLIIREDIAIEKHAFVNSQIEHLVFETSLNIGTSQFAEMHSLQQVDFLEPPISIQKDAFIRSSSTIVRGEYSCPFTGKCPKIEYDNKMVSIFVKNKALIAFDDIKKAFSQFTMYDLGDIKFGGICSERTPNYLMTINIIDSSR